MIISQNSNKKPFDYWYIIIIHNIYMYSNCKNIKSITYIYN